MKKVLLVAASAGLLAGCASNNTVRGMSQKNWNGLNAEQKQLVIDSAYQKQVMQTPPMHETLLKGK